MSVHRSVVKWFDAKKGYGFILHPNGGRDVFVHYSEIVSEERFKTLHTGQLVAFEMTEGPKGAHAHNVVSEDVESIPSSGEGFLSMGSGLSSLRPSDFLRALRR